MKPRLRFTALLVLGFLFGGGAHSLATSADAPRPRYVCPPCGQPCDSTVFDKPGVCPQCGMALVDQAAVGAAAHARKRVAILIFNGVQIIDYTGPYEVFGAADFDVYTVAATKDPVTTVMGMTVVPKYTFADAPQPDVLVVPGGGVKGARDSAPTLKWVKDVNAQAEHTLSVCNGAFILASAGLLDGLAATTTAGNIARLKAEYPGIRVVDDRRFVDNGKIVTAGGLSAGIDGALHVVARMLGDGTAQKVALAEEYQWRPDGSFARAALADMQIPDVNVDGFGEWQIVSTQGGTERWDLVLRGTSAKSSGEVLDHFGQTFEDRGQWKRVDAPATSPGSTATRRWRFTGHDGKPWTGSMTIQDLPGASRRYEARLAIARADQR